MSLLKIAGSLEKKYFFLMFDLNRFYLFSCRSPRDLSSVDNDRNNQNVIYLQILDFFL